MLVVTNQCAYQSAHGFGTMHLLFVCLQAVAKSFGFSGLPRVNLNIESRASHARKAAKAKVAGADYRRFKGQSGHTFSAANPYGVRAAGDKRQITRY